MASTQDNSDPDYSTLPIEYASNPVFIDEGGKTDASVKRELYDSSAPLSFWNSILRAEIGPHESSNFIDGFFRISQRGSTIMTEITGTK